MRANNGKIDQFSSGEIKSFDISLQAEQLVVDGEVVGDGLVELALVAILVLFHAVSLHVQHQVALLHRAPNQHQFVNLGILEQIYWWIAKLRII